MIAARRFVALDFETSGLRPGEHAPVTLGVALFDGGEVIDSREWLITTPTDKQGRVNRAYDVVALEISGTSWTKIKREGLKHEQVLIELRDFVSEHQARYLPVVAFNAAFDLAWYSDLLFLGGCWNQVERRFVAFPPPLAGPWICSRMIALHEAGGLERYDLNTVAAACQLSREGQRHGALDDAILAGQIFDRIAMQMEVAA